MLGYVTNNSNSSSFPMHPLPRWNRGIYLGIELIHFLYAELSLLILFYTTWHPTRRICNISRSSKLVLNDFHSIYFLLRNFPYFLYLFLCFSFTVWFLFSLWHLIARINVSPFDFINHQPNTCPRVNFSIFYFLNGFHYCALLN